MKKILIALGLFLFCSLMLKAQQVPLYSQYYYNPFIYNPALTGHTENARAFFIYRKQWVDFEGAPETRALTFDSPLMDRRVGLGLYVFNDITDVFRRYGGYASYAYHLPFGKGQRLSIGLMAGAQDMRVDFDRVFVVDPSDVAVANNNESGATFDASLGLNYEWNDLDIGFSIPQILATQLKYLNDDQPTFFTLSRHYLLSAGYDIGLKDDMFFVSPHAMFRTPDFSNFQVDAGVTLKYKDKIWLDGTYRYNYGLTIGTGAKVHNAISIGYSYDLSLNNIKDYSGGTHEILLGVTFGRKKGGDGASINEEDMAMINSRLAAQDSTITVLKAEMDSLQNQVDSLGQILAGEFELEMDFAELDSMKARLEAVDMAAMDSMRARLEAIDASTIDSLKARLAEVERQLDERVGQLQEQVDITRQAQEDMAEERTRIVDEEDLEYKHGAELGDYFMVVGSFRIEENSYGFEQSLTQKGYSAGVVFDKKRKWYYVYISQHGNLEKGLEELYKLRETNPEFKDAWIHIMSKTMR